MDKDYSIYIYYKVSDEYPMHIVSKYYILLP